MNALIEMFPFIFGVLLGITWLRLDGPRKRIAPWATASLALGAFATLASGEWRESIVYFLFDIGLVVVVSVATTVILQHWHRRRRTI